MKQFWQISLVAGFLCIMAGCEKHLAAEPVTVTSLTDRLADPLWLAHLDQPDTKMHSSYDRTGGNNDYGTFLRDSRTPGWKVIADLKGPGFVSRIWFTGARDGYPHRFRFYFDGEKKPRLEGDIKELFSGQMAAFPAPLAEYKNYCWYSFVPMPYAKSLRIECEEGPSGAKVYYQISESALPKGALTKTFVWPLPESDLAVLGKVSAIWKAGRRPGKGERQEVVLTDWARSISFKGPAVIRRLEFNPEWESMPLESRDAMLRDWMVSISYNGSTNESVRVPLGDLCGVPWRRVRAQSLFFGMEGDSLFCAFPMPFAESMEIRLTSERIAPVPVEIRAWVEKQSELSIGKMGYFHARWSQTTPDNAGTPHPVLCAKGSGKYVGCLLAVCTLDGSYWALEGDESIRKDGERMPGWRGTGLEDYFNGGWYYQNVMAGPTHGLFIKEPFRTVQYRVHMMDPSCFKESLDMVFERGPDQMSRAYFESVGWYYLSHPQAADTVLPPPENRRMPQDARLDPVIAMTMLWNYERFDDWQGERDALALRLKKYGSQLPETSLRMLEFRLALLDEKLGGTNPLPQFLADTNSAVRMSAEMIQRQRTGEAALAVFYADMPVKLFVDGEEVMQAGRPERAAAASLKLSSGRHVLVIQAPRQRYPDWVQLAIRGRNWFAGTDTSWKFAFNPPGDWKSPDFDDSSWPELGGTGVKGPPEEPFVWVEYDPFLAMQSKATGIRPSMDWPARGRSVVYRKTITVP